MERDPSSTDRQLRIEWTSAPADLSRVEPAWRALEQRVTQRTHVSTFDFLAPWYRWYAGEYGGTALVGFAWDGDALAGIAPLTLRPGTLGRIPVTRIDFAPNDSIAGEFLVPGDRPDVVTALLESLMRDVKFDVICLNGFDPASAQLAALCGAATRLRLTPELEDHAFAIVDLRPGYEHYYNGLSAHYRRNLGQKARKIAAAGAAVDGVVMSDGLDRLDESIDRMIRITEASYKLAGERLADRHRGFLRDVCTRFGRRGMLCMPILSIGGRDAAFILGIVEGETFYDVTLAYDESFARLSPGAHLMQHTLERLPSRGICIAVSHGAHEYKRRWSTAFVPQRRLFLFSPRPRAAASRLARFSLQPIWQRLDRSASPPTSHDD